MQHVGPVQPIPPHWPYVAAQAALLELPAPELALEVDDDPALLDWLLVLPVLADDWVLLEELADDWPPALLAALLVDVVPPVLDWPLPALDAPEPVAEEPLLTPSVVLLPLPLETPVPVVEFVTVAPWPLDAGKLPPPTELWLAAPGVVACSERTLFDGSPLSAAQEPRACTTGTRRSARLT